MRVVSRVSAILLELGLVTEVQNLVGTLGIPDALEVSQSALIVLDNAPLPLIEIEIVVAFDVEVSYPQQSFGSLRHLLLVLPEDQEVVRGLEESPHVGGEGPLVSNKVGPLDDPVVVLPVLTSNVQNNCVWLLHLFAKCLRSKRLKDSVECLLEVEGTLLVLLN